MLQIGDRLNDYKLGAGEAFIMSVQMRAMSGSAIIDWSARRLVLSFYAGDREPFDTIEGVYTNDPTGPYFAFVRDGRFSESMVGKSVQVELAERLLETKDIIATGPLTVTTSAAGVRSFGRVIGNIDARFTLYFDAIGMIVLVEQDLLPFPGLPRTAAPLIDTPAAINSDGSPMVGETFTGIDATGNGPVVARRWIDATGTTSDVQTYVGATPGPLIWENSLRGPDGTTIISRSTIMVVTAPETADNTLANSSLLVTQVDGAQAAFAPIVTSFQQMGYL